MREYNVDEISYEYFGNVDNLVIMGTSNKTCFDTFIDGIKKSKFSGIILLIGHASALSYFHNSTDFNVKKCVYEGSYDKKIAEIVNDFFVKGENNIFFFFSQDPYIDRNNNIFEIVYNVANIYNTCLITMEFGGRKLFKYASIAETFKETDIFLQNKYRLIRQKDYSFEDRRKNSDTLCIVLAGYKRTLYDVVFTRLKKNVESNVDVCIITSGIFNEELALICRNNEWSYLSTAENNVSAAQNIAIEIHQSAHYIYKIDEDIFITKNFFDTIKKTYEYVEKNGDFRPGIVAPLILLNGYSTIRILEKLNLRKQYSIALGKLDLPRMADRDIYFDPETAKFMWGEGGYVPQLDVLDEQFYSAPFFYSLCPIKFSIGAIFYTRDYWKDIGMFHLQRYGASIGQDEDQICTFAVLCERPTVIAENTVVGHLAFGNQTDEMMKFFEKNRSFFEMKEKC